jgi:hypothetical protein
VTRRGIGPGHPDYEWLKRLETRNNERLGIKAPDPIFKARLEWNIADLRCTERTGDWAGWHEACQRLARLLAEAQRQQG